MRYHGIPLCVVIIVGSVSNKEPQTEQKHDTPTKEIPPKNVLPENNVEPKADNNPPLGSREVSKEVFKFNKREGDKAFKKKQFKEALILYKHAKEHMREAKRSDLIDMFCNLADCFQFLEQYHTILEERNQFWSYIETSFEVQFNFGIIFVKSMNMNIRIFYQPHFFRLNLK